MVPDVEKHEEKKMRFLAALYDVAQEYMRETQETHDPTDVREFRATIAKRAGLDDGESERIGAELERQGLLEKPDWFSDPAKGPEYFLTQYGLEEVERYLYEKSSLAKRRKIVGAIKETSASATVSILKEAGKWLGGIVIGAVGASYAPMVTRWVKELLGIK